MNLEEDRLKELEERIDKLEERINGLKEECRETVKTGLFSIMCGCTLALIATFMWG